MHISIVNWERFLDSGRQQLIVKVVFADVWFPIGGHHQGHSTYIHQDKDPSRDWHYFVDNLSVALVVFIFHKLLAQLERMHSHHHRACSIDSIASHGDSCSKFQDFLEFKPKVFGV